ncbi:hypothetical protein [Nocardia grenadensis]|uniref:hypothetical protein n=1 Tax=Nocardia grenadensis TaxID=931537 RepID=UPI003D7468E8
MLTGAVPLLAALGSALALSLADSGDRRAAAAIAVWADIGVGTAAILTPTGQVPRRSSRPADRPALFAAQFPLSHLAWLLTYPIAGQLTTATGSPRPGWSSRFSVPPDSPRHCGGGSATIRRS